MLLIYSFKLPTKDGSFKVKWDSLREVGVFDDLKKNT